MFAEAVPIKGFDGYKVDREGNVWSCRARNGRGVALNAQRKLKPKISKQGYCLVTLARNKKHYSLRVHRIVAEAFLPNPNLLPIIRHLNSDPRDNNVNNLMWGTPKENIADEIKRGTFVGFSLRGEKHWNNRLKKEDVLFIRKSLREGVKRKILQNLFKVSKEHIRDIGLGKAWSWL